MRVGAILFDLDGTLYSRERAFGLWVRAEAGAAAIDWRKVAELDARGRGPKGPLLEYLAGALGWPEMSFHEKLARFRAGVAGYATAPRHLLEVLDRLRGSYRLGLVSNGSSEAQRAKVRALGVEAYFEPVLISEEVGIRKPDPRIFWMAAEHWQIPRDEILCVGDDEIADVQGALNAGLRALRLEIGAANGRNAISDIADLEGWLSVNVGRDGVSGFA